MDSSDLLADLLPVGAPAAPGRSHGRALPEVPEGVNLIQSPDEKAQAALRLLTTAARQFPKTDGHPRYDPLPAQPWDKKVPKEKEDQ